jgi:hypothetical protein
VDVVPGRQEDVEIARVERASPEELQTVAAGTVELLVLLPAVEADEAPGTTRLKRHSE